MRDAIKLAKTILREATAQGRNNNLAISGEERTILMAEREAMQFRKGCAEEELKLIDMAVKDCSELLTAAEFVSDVDGDDPSIPQLKKAVIRRKRFLVLKAEVADLFGKIRSQPIHSFRCEIIKPGPIGGIYVMAQGDTWEDVCCKIEKKATA